jgi:hypothetical protein
MHKRPEIVDQGTAVVLGAGVAAYCLGERVDGLGVGRRIQRDGDRGFFQRRQFGFYAQSFFLQLGDALLGVLLTGLQRDDGGIEWTFGRNRGLSL